MTVFFLLHPLPLLPGGGDSAGGNPPPRRRGVCRWKSSSQEGIGAGSVPLRRMGGGCI